MRNFFRLLGIIALVAVIGFSMAACDTGGGGSGTGGDGNGGGGSGSGTNNLEFDHLAFGNGIFVAVGNDTLDSSGTARIGYSADSGKTWTRVNQSSVNSIFPISLGSYVVSSIAYGGGKFIAVGAGKTAISTDGKNWTAGGTVSVATDCIAYGNNTFVSDTDMPGELLYSKDGGSTWTTVPKASTGLSNQIDGIGFGNGMFVAADTSGNFITSTDGVTWTAGKKFSYGPDVIAYGAGKFVGTTNGSTIMYSSDPSSAGWATVSLPGGISTEDIAYGNGKFVVVGSLGSTKMFTSTDGVTWTAATVPSTFESYDSLECIAFGNDTFVIGNGKTRVAYFK